MKELFEQHLDIIIVVFVSSVITFKSFDVLSEIFIPSQTDAISEVSSTRTTDVIKQFEQYNKPAFTVKNDNISLPIGASFDYIKTPGITASDTNEGKTVSLTDKIVKYGNVDTNTAGEYRVRYVVSNQYGIKSEIKIKVIVD